PGVVHPVVPTPSPVARGSPPPLPPASPVSAGPVGAPYPGVAVPGVARQVQDFKPLEFGVAVQADPNKQFKGIWQARLSKEGLRLRQRKKEDLIFPVGTRVAFVKGNVIAVPVESRWVELTVTKFGHYNNRLASDLVAFLNGELPEPDPRGYR